MGTWLKASETRSNIKRDLLIAGALSLAGALTRVPYLALIPVFEDEALQTVYALAIRPGEFLPLVGNDPYAGPLFSYILAVSMRVFASPVTPRIVAMVMGALTVGLTYLLARALSLAWPWAALAGLLMAANPHHILINSHYAGTTYALPLFSTAFLLALALAVKRESGPWRVAAGALLGLALQTNPVPLLMLPGVAVWFLIQRNPRIGLRTRWPYLAAVAFLVAYAPVILYNLQTGLAGVSAAESGRSYLWQPNPSPAAFAQNLWRLTLQLCRQVSGVLEGDETLQGLLGAPLLFSAWAIAGLIYAARRGLTLPALAVGSQLLIMPWLSNHYGLTGTTRFTNQLTPLIFVAMAALAASVWNRVQARPQSSVVVLRPPTFVAPLTASWGYSRAAGRATCILLVALSLWPLTSLFRYYDHKVAAGETNAHYFAFADEFMRQWHGEKIFLSSSGVPQATEYFLAIKAVPYIRLPVGRIMEQLATGQETGRVTLILNNDDWSRAQPQAEWTIWNSPIMQDADKHGYGVVTIADARQVHKPSYVLTPGTSALAPTARAVQVNFAEGLSMIGYEIKPNPASPGQEFVVNIYWQASRAMTAAYTGFVHLVGPDGRLVTQDDHELGRGFYRTIFWQPGEVIRERYVLTLPQSPGGNYALWAGAYDFPSLQRLIVRSADKPTQDNRVMLDTIHVGP